MQRHPIHSRVHHMTGILSFFCCGDLGILKVSCLRFSSRPIMVSPHIPVPRPTIVERQLVEDGFSC